MQAKHKLPGIKNLASWPPEVQGGGLLCPLAVNHASLTAPTKAQPRITGKETPACRYTKLSCQRSINQDMIEVRHLPAGWVLANLFGKLIVIWNPVEVDCGLAQRILVSPAGAAPVWRQHPPLFYSTYPVINIVSLFGVAYSTPGLVAVCANSAPAAL